MTTSNAPSTDGVPPTGASQPPTPPRVAASPRVRLSTLLPIVLPFAVLLVAAYAQWILFGLPLGSCVSWRDAGKCDRAARIRGLAAHHSLCKSSLHGPARPQRIANPHGSSAALLERPLHARYRVDSLHAGAGPARSTVHGQGRRTLSVAMGRPARRPAHAWDLPATGILPASCSGCSTGRFTSRSCFTTNHWRRIVPTSWQVFPDAWAVFVHYATFHLPPEPNGFYQYNALQQLSYFAVIFILAPLSILTGPSMSPALVNRFAWYRKLPGNRQVGRSIHFLVLCAYVAFVIAHVTMVLITGFARNMNHIVIGTDDPLRFGMYIGLTGLVILFLANVMANWATWLFPRAIQHIGDAW